MVTPWCIYNSNYYNDDYTEENDEIVHLKAEELKIVEHETDKFNVEADVEHEVTAIYNLLNKLQI